MRLRSGPQPMRSRAGRHGRDELGQLLDLGRPHPADVRGAGDRPLAGGGQVLLETTRVVRAELLVHRAPLLEQAGHGVGEHDVGARAHGQVEVGAVGHAGPAGIDHHQPGAVGLGLGQERQEVGVGDRRVGAPDHDEPAGRHVQRIGRQHVAEGVVPGLAGGGRTDGVGHLGHPQPGEQQRGQRLRRQHRGRRAVEVGQHAGRSVVAERGADPGRHQLDRLVPRRLPEGAGSLRPGAHEGRQDPLRPVDPAGVVLHLVADVAGRERVAGRGVDRGQASVLDGDGEGARVRAVEGARGGERGHGPCSHPTEGPGPLTNVARR